MLPMVQLFSVNSGPTVR